MAERLDFSIRNPIPAKGSYLQLDSVISVHFGKDRAVMGGERHRGAVAIFTESIERDTDYLFRAAVENKYPEVPLLLQVTNQANEILFAQSVRVKKDKANFIFNIPPSEGKQLCFTLSYDYESQAFSEMPKVVVGGDFVFISIMIEAL